MTNEGPQYDDEQGTDLHVDQVDVTPPATEVSDKNTSHPVNTMDAALAQAVIDRPSGANVFETGDNRSKRRFGVKAVSIIALTALGAFAVVEGKEPAIVKRLDRKTRLTKGQGGSSGTGGSPDKTGTGAGGTPNKGAGGAGGQEPYQGNACDAVPFNLDAKEKDMGEPGNLLGVCTFIPNADGTIRAIGSTVIDQNGIPQDCFFSDTWTGGDFIKIRGEADGNKIDPSQKGKIYLKDGKMCLFQANETPVENSEAIILGEAPLHVKTEGKVMIKRETETDASTGTEKHFVTVLAVEGKTVIHQDGNNPPDWTIEPGDEQYRFQLDINRVNTGCMITSPAKNGTEDIGGAMMLCAGAAFYLLRRKDANGSNR